MNCARRGIVISMLSLGVVATLVHPVEAGRRRRRAAAIAVVAAAAVPKRPTVVAVAPAAARTRRAAVVAARPDLTVAKMHVDGETLVMTVTNAGRAASPRTLLQVDLRDPVDVTLLATHVCRVPALAVRQSVRIVMRSVPLGDVHVAAMVDPEKTVAESNEANNDRAIRVAPPVQASEPVELAVEEVWGEPVGTADAARPLGN